MIGYIILLIAATIGVAIISIVDKFSKNKILKYGSYVLYFFLLEFIIYSVTDSLDIPIILLIVLVGIFALVGIIKGSYILTSGNKLIKYALSAVFVVIAGFAFYKLYDVIMNPIRFNNAKYVRYKETIDELKRIRTAEKSYKNEYNKYTDNLDSLKLFIETGEMTIIKKEGIPSDSIYLEAGNDLAKAERIALKRGLIKRDTLKIAIKDTLFKNYDLKRFGKVPFVGGQFELDTASITSGGGELTIGVFRARISNLYLLDGLDRQLILNLNDDAIKNDRYPGLKVGAIKENNNGDGNWDKEFDLIK